MDQDDNNPTGKKLEVELNPQIAQGIYSNMNLITYTDNEFIIDHASSLPGIIKPRILVRVLLNPKTAKALAINLQKSVEDYENKFGEISLTTNRLPDKLN